MAGDERTGTEGLAEDESLLQPCNELLTALHGMTPHRRPFFSVLPSTVLLGTSLRRLYARSISQSLTPTPSDPLRLFLLSTPARCLSAVFPRGNDEYLRSDRNGAPNPFCPGQLFCRLMGCMRVTVHLTF